MCVHEQGEYVYARVHTVFIYPTFWGNHNAGILGQTGSFYIFIFQNLDDLMDSFILCLKLDQILNIRIEGNFHISFIIKQDSHIYVPYSRPNGWTDWAEIFCGHSEVAGGCHRLKKFEIFSFKIFHGQRRALQLVVN